MIKGFLFDLDGVIVDTAKYHYLAWKRLADELSIPFTENDNERLKGVSRMRSLEIILEIGKQDLSADEKEARKKVYEALKKSVDVMNKTFAFNTLISSSMEALNALNKQDNATVWLEGYYILSNILEPIIPHTCWEIADKLFAKANFDKTIEIKEEVFVLDSVTLAITINGKKRGEIEVSPDATKEEILELAKATDVAKKWIDGKELIKEIVVPKKLVNLVVKG